MVQQLGQIATTGIVQSLDFHVAQVSHYSGWINPGIYGSCRQWLLPVGLDGYKDETLIITTYLTQKGEASLTLASRLLPSNKGRLRTRI